MASRNRTLDGLRGCLALIVFAFHAGALPTGLIPATSVRLFFVISGYVLVRAWDGRFVAFLIRRAVRLWPIYALCLTVGYALLGVQPSLLLYVWLGSADWAHPPIGDPPAWSLMIEAWAMLLMPIFVYAARGSSVRFLLIAIVFLLASFIAPYVFYALYFLAGGRLSRISIQWSPLETPLPQWLGRISYPLYLCHWPIIYYAGIPGWAVLPLVFGVAAVLTATVEKWSIQASRELSRLMEFQ